MNLDRLKSLRSEVNSQPNEKWFLIDRAELSSLLLWIELHESVLRGEGGVGRKLASQGEKE